MQFLAHVSDDVLPPSERVRWEEEYDRLISEKKQWAQKAKLNFSEAEIHYLTVLQNPRFWAAETFKWVCRDYQEPMLQEMADSKRTVLRLGRRLGKTETMCIMILWYAFTQPNKGTNNQYNILIITPYEAQSKLISDRLHQLIDMSPDVAESVERDIDGRIEFGNGTIITMMTAGSKSGTGAAATRGQRADLIILDECDYMTSNDITNIMNIRNEAPERIRMIAASTPCGKREDYYKWCTGATVTYSYDEVGTEAAGRVQYVRSLKPFKKNGDGTFKTNKLGHKIRDGNGWTTIHAPSSVNPELLKVNPDTGLTYLEELQIDLTQMRYEQEVLAEFGESLSGVFLKKHIDFAVENGRKLGVSYNVLQYDQKVSDGMKPFTLTDFTRRGPRILGVDWDKRNADTNMIGVEWNEKLRMFIPFMRVSIPRGEFTYDLAVEAIKKADHVFNFDYILCDAGHGESQIEQLRRWGKAHPQTRMAHKVIRINLSEKVKVFDPVTRKVEKKHIKPFMVNNAVLMFERGLVALNPNDKETITQFEGYEVKSWKDDGRPTYTDVNEHILDCFVFCLFGFVKYYDDIMKVTKATAIYALKNPLDRSKDNVKSRGVEVSEQPTEKRAKAALAKLGIQTKNRSNGEKSRARMGMGMPKRGSF